MKKYKTEEERKEAQREAKKRWREKNKEYQTIYRQNNKEKIAEYNTLYYQKNKEYFAKYYQNNKEKIAEWYQNNKERAAVHQAKYFSTPYGRASKLITAYKQSDKKHNRGECTLTAQWIVDNIFSKPCHYCGETDWHKLGCDRIDNIKPHTPSNVVPCCCECNKKRGRNTYDEFTRNVLKIVNDSQPN